MNLSNFLIVIDVAEILKNARVESSVDIQPLQAVNYLFEDLALDK